MSNEMWAEIIVFLCLSIATLCFAELLHFLFVKLPSDMHKVREEVDETIKLMRAMDKKLKEKEDKDDYE